MLGTLIIGLTGSIGAAKAQKKGGGATVTDPIPVPVQITCYETSAPLEEELEIKGNVVDEDRQAIAGAPVIIKSTKRGLVTDMYGNFIIKALPSDTLLFNLIGYKEKEIAASSFLNKDNKVILEINNDIELSCYIVVTVDEAPPKKEILPVSSSTKLLDATGKYKPELKGKVVDEIGLPIAAVSVIIKGKKNGTVTDDQGHFTLKTKPGDTLVFSYTGLITEEVPVSELRDGQPMIMRANRLDDVTVVGSGLSPLYGITCYAVQVVDERYHKLDVEKTNITTRIDANIVNSETPVSGIVKDPDGTPLLGVTVTIKGRAVESTLTDEHGNFKINARKGEIIVFRYVGYKTVEKRADKITGKANVIKLKEDVK